MIKKTNKKTTQNSNNINKKTKTKTKIGILKKKSLISKKKKI